MVPAEAEVIVGLSDNNIRVSFKNLPDGHFGGMSEFCEASSRDLHVIGQTAYRIAKICPKMNFRLMMESGGIVFRAGGVEIRRKMPDQLIGLLSEAFAA